MAGVDHAGAFVGGLDMRVGFVLAVLHQRPDGLHGGGGHRVEKFGEAGKIIGLSEVP